MEKRGPSPRYTFRCEVDVYQNGSTAPLHGVMSDISLTGCYIETITPEPAGTRLDVAFSARGKQYRVAGIVRVVHPTMGMGIQFAEVTPAVQQQLELLINAQVGS